MKTENGTFYRYLYGRLTDSRSDLGMAMDGYGYDDTEMERGGQGKVKPCRPLVHNLLTQ